MIRDRYSIYDNNSTKKSRGNETILVQTWPELCKYILEVHCDKLKMHMVIPRATTKKHPPKTPIQFKRLRGIKIACQKNIWYKKAFKEEQMKNKNKRC